MRRRRTIDRLSFYVDKIFILRSANVRRITKDPEVRRQYPLVSRRGIREECRRNGLIREIRVGFIAAFTASVKYSLADNAERENNGIKARAAGRVKK